MALAHAVLSLLSQKPCSGYEIAKAFDGSVGYFWQATHQQIYRELKKLEEQQWVSVEVIPQEKPLDKKVYALTPLGQQKLAEWIDEESDLGPLREDILVKVFAGHLVPSPVLLRQLEHHRRQHLKRLATYQTIAAEYFPNPDQLTFEQRCQYLTLRRGISNEESWIAWCDEAIEALQQESK
jgi:DNA-binding PadR family transcriptional regulator